MTQADAAEKFERDGYAILNGVIAAPLREAFWSEVEAALATAADLQVLEGERLVRNADRAVPFGPLRQPGLPTSRITDIEFHVPMSLTVALHRQVTDFLRAVYGGPPTLLQTLTYAYSSEQGAHSDRYLVNSRQLGEYDRDSLAAAWIAIEDADDDNGALVLWPGSHRVAKPRLDEDFAGDYDRYRQALEALLQEAGIEPIRFYAKAGDVLFWNGDLVHAGGPINAEGRTRKSLVCHYASCGTRPRSIWWQREAVALGDGFYFKRKKKGPVRALRQAVRRRLGQL